MVTQYYKKYRQPGLPVENSTIDYALPMRVMIKATSRWLGSTPARNSGPITLLHSIVLPFHVM
jgi:hypothetical protein